MLLDLTTFQVDRWNEIFKSRLDWAIEKGLDKDFIEDLYKVIHLGSINVQNKIINRKDPTYLLKAIKNKTEIKNMIDAHILDGVALTKFLYWIKKINKKKN